MTQTRRNHHGYRRAIVDQFKADHRRWELRQRALHRLGGLGGGLAGYALALTLPMACGKDLPRPRATRAIAKRNPWVAARTAFTDTQGLNQASGLGPEPPPTERKPGLPQNDPHVIRTCPVRRSAFSWYSVPRHAEKANKSRNVLRENALSPHQAACLRSIRRAMGQKTHQPVEYNGRASRRWNARFDVEFSKWAFPG